MNNMTDVVLKLCSGEEIFTSIIKIDGELITFDTPMKVFKKYEETASGLAIKLNYEPFLDYSGTTKHILHRQHIMSCEPLIPQLSKLYADMKIASDDMTSSSSLSRLTPGSLLLH